MKVEKEIKATTKAQRNKALSQRSQEEKDLEQKWDEQARQLRKKIVNLSPAFVKIAQALATRPDIVSERLAKELQRLQDDMPFFSNEEAFAFSLIRAPLSGAWPQWPEYTRQYLSEH